MSGEDEVGTTHQPKVEAIQQREPTAQDSVNLVRKLNYGFGESGDEGERHRKRIAAAGKFAEANKKRRR